MTKAVVWTALVAMMLATAAWAAKPAKQAKAPAKPAKPGKSAVAPAPPRPAWRTDDVPAEPDDPIWDPSRDDLDRWVLQGIHAGARNRRPEADPAIANCLWLVKSGRPIPGAKVHFVLVVTPRLIATAAGYAATWDTQLWQRIEKDERKVAAELAARVTTKGRVTIYLGLEGKWAEDQAAVVWHRGGWRRAAVISTESVGDPSLKGGLARPGLTREGRLDAEWAAGYLLGRAVQNGEAQRDWQAVKLHLTREPGPARPTDTVVTAMLKTMPAPKGSGRTFFRIAIGAPGRYAYADVTTQ